MRGIFIDIFYFSGFFHFIYLINRLYGSFPILVFHRVSPHFDYLTEPLAPSDFENIIRDLGKYYNYTSFDAIEGEKNPCIVTFDDATGDFEKYALPVIVRYNVPTVLFIPTEAARSKEEIWTNHLFSIFHNNQDENLEVTINDRIYEVNNSGRARILQIREIVKILTQMSRKERSKIIYSIRSNCRNKKNIPLTTTLSMPVLTEIYSKHAKLIKYGSHSHTHSCLHVLDKDELYDELFYSKKLVEKVSDIDCRMIAYPSGMFDSIVVEATKRLYGYAFTTESVLASRSKINCSSYRYNIPRISVYTNNSRELFLRINGLEVLVKISKKIIHLF